MIMTNRYSTGCRSGSADKLAKIVPMEILKPSDADGRISDTAYGCRLLNLK